MVKYMVPINFPKGISVFKPYLPIAKDMPPKAPMGARYITYFKPIKT